MNPGSEAVLTCVLEKSEPVTVLRATGPLDIGGAVHMRTALHKALSSQPAALVVDLADTVVVDDVALTVLSAFTRFASGWGGCPLLLSAPNPVVRDALDRMRVVPTANVFDDLGRALAASTQIPPPRRYALRLAATRPAADDARVFVRDACVSWNLSHLVENAEVVVTELVANVVAHVGGALDLHVTLRERYLHLAVRDDSRIMPVRRLPDVESGEGGRGLLLVEAMAARWGSAEVPDGKVVWATLRIDGQAPSNHA